MSYFFGRAHLAVAFPSPVTIAVNVDDLSSAVFEPGSLKAISPEEPRHALIFAIARDIDAGSPTAELRAWRDLILSAIITFKTVTTDDEIFRLSTNARESIGAQFEVLYFSTVPPCSHLPTTAIPTILTRRVFHLLRTPTLLRQAQRIFQLAMPKTTRMSTTCQSLSAPDLTTEFAANVFISSGEAVTPDYTRSALAVYDRIFADDICRNIVLSAAPSHLQINDSASRMPCCHITPCWP
jgi:hypothetical protein